MRKMRKKVVYIFIFMRVYFHENIQKSTEQTKMRKIHKNIDKIAECGIMY